MPRDTAQLPTVRWRRIEAGWYRTEIDGVRYEAINMHGESVRYSGVASIWKAATRTAGGCEMAPPDTAA